MIITTVISRSATEEAVDSLLIATVKSPGSDGLRVTWTKVGGASGYDIYYTTRYTTATYQLAGTVSSSEIAEFNVTDLKPGFIYRVTVKAWTISHGRKQYIATSPVAYFIISSDTDQACNVQSLTIPNRFLTLRKGETVSIQGEVMGIDEDTDILIIPGELRYISDEASIAKVNPQGEVTAQKAGVCLIYVITPNGDWLSVFVTVEE